MTLNLSHQRWSISYKQPPPSPSPTCTPTHSYLAPEDGEGQSTGFAELSGTPWAGGGVGGVPSTGGEAEGPRPRSEPRLLSPHRARAHHLVQQPAAWRPHGRRPRLQSKRTNTRPKEVHFAHFDTAAISSTFKIISKKKKKEKSSKDFSDAFKNLLLWCWNLQ